MDYSETSVGKQSEVVTVTKSEWKTIGIRIKTKDLPLFNRRLSLYGFETLGALVADFLTGKFPVITEDRQIQTLDSNIRYEDHTRWTIRTNILQEYRFGRYAKLSFKHKKVS